ncbi:MAG: hypothetical protein K9J17_05485 [Flavobacteriales bacterium]|nr:hypothetical protein [Flavobacteriales bacterium]
MEKFPEQFNSNKPEVVPVQAITVQDLSKLGPALAKGLNAAMEILFTVSFIHPKADQKYLIDSLTDGDVITEDQARDTIENLIQKKIIAENPDGTYKALVKVRPEDEAS